MGTLDDIVAKSAGLKTPTLIVVGDVVKLREAFSSMGRPVADGVETAIWGKAVR